VSLAVYRSDWGEAARSLIAPALSSKRTNNFVNIFVESPFNQLRAWIFQRLSGPPSSTPCKRCRPSLALRFRRAYQGLKRNAGIPNMSPQNTRCRCVGSTPAQAMDAISLSQSGYFGRLLFLRDGSKYCQKDLRLHWFRQTFEMVPFRPRRTEQRSGIECPENRIM